MIKVKLSILETNRFFVLVVGHAEYAKKGKDIVCAAASAIIQGTVKGLREVVKSDVRLNTRDGEYSFEVEKNEKTEILIYSMLISLKDLSIQYPKYIHITEENKNAPY